MRNKTIYISGKITGLDLKEAENNFNQAEEYLKIQGYTVLNPMKLVPYEKGKTWEEYMLDDIKLLFGCDEIYMLDNWESSKGARIEMQIAVNMGKNINFQYIYQ